MYSQQLLPAARCASSSPAQSKESTYSLTLIPHTLLLEGHQVSSVYGKKTTFKSYAHT